MTRRRARHLMLEISRRLYLQEHGNLKGFGKTQIYKFYNDDWRHRDYSVTRGYKNAWNSECMLMLRKAVGM